MEESLVTQVTRYLKSQRRRKIGYQILTCMASVVVFCTVYALILPAITISNELTCGLEQHEHDESCYTMAPAAAQPELICDTTELPGLALHTHNQFCYDNDNHLICTLTEREAHTHGRSCYQEHLNLICDEVQVMGHAHTSACYAKERGELVCTEEEGTGAHTHTDGCLSVTEKEVLSCGKTEEPAHTHDESCYTTRTKETLVCGEREESAHTHGGSCYTTKTSRTLVCTESEGPDEVDEEGNVISSGHSHSGGCYETEEETSLTCTEEETAGHSHSAGCYESEEETVLSCTLRESEGHSHDGSCYKTETETTVLCGQEEGAGHVHGDSCFEWSERLTCTEEEHPAGHIHGDECYETETVLACRQMEMEEHVHGESCYDEEGELTCTRREISSHQHTADCVFTPESTGEEVLTLTCGLEEHIHNEVCYVDIVPPEDQEFFCGFPAHTHVEECYFEDGVTLRCTVPEHIHTEECREPPAPEEPKYTGAEGVELDNEFTYEDDAFLVRFHITGYAPLLYDEEPITMEDDSFYSAGPLSEEPAEPAGETEPVGETGPEAETVPDPVEKPETSDEAAEYGDGEADDSFGGFAGDEGFTFAGDAADGVVLLNPEDVVFTVETLSEDSREYQRMASHAEEYGDNEELPMLEVLTFSAEIDGQELDLSGCTVEVEITLSELLVEYLESYGESQAMAIPEDGVFDEPAFDEGGETSEAASFTLMAYTVRDGELNEIGSADTSKETSTAGELSRNSGNKVAIALLPKVFPLYTVQYYANLDRPAVGERPDGGDEALPFIDTSKETGKGKLPANGELDTNGGIIVKELWINSGGTVIFEPELTPVYQPEEFRFNPKLEGDESTRLTVDSLDALTKAKNDHYTLAGMQVFQPGPGRDPENEEDWSEPYSLEQLKNLRFTNNDQGTGDNVVLLQELEDGSKTILRLIYDPVSDMYNNDVTLFDYDITDGSAEGTNPIRVKAKEKGINHPSNYTGSGTKFAFGNTNTGSGLGDLQWNGNFLNKGNYTGTWKDPHFIGYQKCTFGLVQKQLGDDGLPKFSGGISAPDLFSGKDVTSETDRVIGKYIVSGHDLQFIQQGDTYTLTEVTGTAAAGLESFGRASGLWTNHFWPMDGLSTGGKDLPFGEVSGSIVNGESGNVPFTQSDNGKDHNNFFGMKFEVKFTLAEEYIGPLEYFFYGDDDMWVFLDGKLVCDIGGVHSSVGEYVDLWDYIEGGRENHHAETHTLSFFYTERGASGSTCWMQYTLPNATNVPQFDKPDTSDRPLRIEKYVEGPESLRPDPTQEYKFTISFENVQSNNIQAVRFEMGNPDLIKEQVEINGTGSTTFCLRANECIEFIGLPSHARYTITEDTSGLDGCKVSATVTSDGTEVGSFQNEPVVGGLGVGQTVVAFTNGFNFELPETGGNGTLLYTLTGALLPAVTGGLWYRKRKSKGEGAVD